jgi:hypothetical protein
VFTELLPGNALIKSVTILINKKKFTTLGKTAEYGKSNDHNQREKQPKLYKKYFNSNSTSILIEILRDSLFIIATIYGLDG